MDTGSRLERGSRTTEGVGQEEQHERVILDPPSSGTNAEARRGQEGRSTLSLPDDLDWEVFPGAQRGRPAAKGPFVVITESKIALSPDAYGALGSPTHVVFLFARSECIIGIKASQADVPYAYPAKQPTRRSRATIQAKDFLAWIDYESDSAQQYLAVAKDDMISVHLRSGDVRVAPQLTPEQRAHVLTEVRADVLRRFGRRGIDLTPCRFDGAPHNFLSDGVGWDLSILEEREYARRRRRDGASWRTISKEIGPDELTVKWKDRLSDKECINMERRTQLRRILMWHEKGMPLDEMMRRSGRSARQLARLLPLAEQVKRQEQ